MALSVHSGPERARCEAALRPSVWDLGNDTLYGLCERYPRHVTPQEIVAKVWLIGRSYAASVERRRSDGLESEAFYAKVVVPALRASSVDDQLRNIGATRRCESTEDAELLLRTHALLIRIFRKASGRANRSLASKYLHFHRPLFFPMFDSRANREIRTMVTGHLEERFPKGDNHYREFLARFMALQDWISAAYGLHLTPRQVDRVLLGY